MTTAFPKTTYGQPTFVIKQNQTREPITYTTVDQNNQAVPITGALSVSFAYRLKSADPSTVVVRAATILDPNAGNLLYQWVAADTAVAGDYYAEWRVVFQDGSKKTFPIVGYQMFTVEAVLG